MSSRRQQLVRDIRLPPKHTRNEIDPQCHRPRLTCPPIHRTRLQPRRQTPHPTHIERLRAVPIQHPHRTPIPPHRFRHPVHIPVTAKPGQNRLPMIRGKPPQHPQTPTQLHHRRMVRHRRRQHKPRPIPGAPLPHRTRGRTHTIVVMLQQKHDPLPPRHATSARSRSTRLCIFPSESINENSHTREKGKTQPFSPNTSASEMCLRARETPASLDAGGCEAGPPGGGASTCAELCRLCGCGLPCRLPPRCCCCVCMCPSAFPRAWRA